ncbi:hypothetical protein [Burkholderia sp. Se-20378]|uniref:hypothetical protein n=1 Tax=Burkholderia sp. Se-20378 TaxID=2703899 RepID=UPI00197DDD95|nr:hypothetical protein [Burkholderia sp. Se-20378]MBN3771191.1 hypothetical protein [Burkholderia sp. Se-20378]
MRYYELNLYRPDDTTKPVRTWTSYPNGRFDPGALDVEFDVLVTAYHTPVGGSSIRVHGVALQDLMQPQQFGMQIVGNKVQPGMYLELKGGMGKGLPLANPAQAQTLLKGQIYQSFGQWEGTEMQLDFTINAADFSSDNPGNYVLNWKAGQPLQTALQNCLSVAHPNMPTLFGISNQLVQSYDEVHLCSTLDELGQLVQEMTVGQFLGEEYPGVSIAINAGAISVFDGSQPPQATVQINFTDLIGQPTWLDAGTMQLMVVMRGDIQVGSQIRMPTGFTSGAGSTIFQSSDRSASAYNYNLTFSGTFLVTGLRHIGHFRSTSGADWSTVVECVPTTPAGSF